MHNLNNDKKRPPNHVNAFIDLNGVPYLLGEYLDRTQLRQIDRSIIRSDIHVNQAEKMRAVVNININDVGTRSNGLPNIIGNKSKQKQFLRMVQKHARRMNHRLDVFKSGIIVRINYHLENQRTGQVIRSAQEDLRIKDRNFFVDINPRNVNDNGIIVNFTNSLVSTLNQFTHGTDRMIIRITQIQLLYEVLRRENPAFAGRQMPEWGRDWIPTMDDIPDFSFSGFHGKHQSHQHIGVPGTCDCDEFITNAQHPPSWFLFNRFYRFDNMGKDIILHTQEIEDRNNRIALVPCGRVIVNRTFIIRPGHRIIWRINIWKNDLTIFNNTQNVARALGVQNIGHPGDKRKSSSQIDKLIELLLQLLGREDGTGVSPIGPDGVKAAIQKVKDLKDGKIQHPGREVSDDNTNIEDVDLDDPFSILEYAFENYWDNNPPEPKEYPEGFFDTCPFCRKEYEECVCDEEED